MYTHSKHIGKPFGLINPSAKWTWQIIDRSFLEREDGAVTIVTRQCDYTCADTHTKEEAETIRLKCIRDGWFEGKPSYVDVVVAEYGTLSFLRGK